MVLSPNKCSFMLFGLKNELQTDLVSNNATSKNNKEGKVLGITIDSKLDFSMHLTSITKKANINLPYQSTKIYAPGQNALLTPSFKGFSLTTVL